MKMVRAKYNTTWEIVKDFEEGKDFYTKEGEGRYSQLTTVFELVRYQYRLYVRESEKSGQ